MTLDVEAWQRHARRLWPVAFVLLVIGAGVGVGAAPMLLVLAAGFLAIGLVLFWSSLTGFTSEEPFTLEEALDLARPTRAEEHKRAVLRALKDLEYERSIGKISEQDYQVLWTRYRAEAKQLLSRLDESEPELRHKVEARVGEYLAHHPTEAESGTASASAAARERARDPRQQKESS